MARLSKEKDRERKRKKAAEKLELTVAIPAAPIVLPKRPKAKKRQTAEGPTVERVWGDVERIDAFDPYIPLLILGDLTEEQRDAILALTPEQRQATESLSYSKTRYGCTLSVSSSKSLALRLKAANTGILKPTKAATPVDHSAARASFLGKLAELSAKRSQGAMVRQPDSGGADPGSLDGGALGSPGPADAAEGPEEEVAS